MNIGRLVARTVIGGLFVGHGTQKLMGWFGGPGLEGTAGMMQSLEMHPPRRNAMAAGVTETAGGTLLTLGLATPLACAGLIGTMITAIRKVHWSSGPWAAAGGYEVVEKTLHDVNKVQDFAPYVSKISATHADTVMTGNWSNDLLLLMKATKAAGLKARFGTVYLDQPGNIANAGDLALGAAG